MSVTNLLTSVKRLGSERGTIDTQSVARELSGSVKFSVDYRVKENEPWFERSGARYDTALEAWEAVDHYRVSPIWNTCFYRVMEHHAAEITDPRETAA